MDAEVTANGRWAPLGYGASCYGMQRCVQKMGPVSGAHPVLARLTPGPQNRGCVTSTLAEGCHLYIALTEMRIAA
jgi:hypothetical protein